MPARLTAATSLTGHRPDCPPPDSWCGRRGLPGLPGRPGRPEVGGSDGRREGGSSVGDGLPAVGVGVGCWLGSAAGGVYAGVDGTSEGAGAGEDEPAGVGVGEPVRGATGHVGASVFAFAFV
jgi:hypothetical protein